MDIRLRSEINEGLFHSVAELRAFAEVLFHQSRLVSLGVLKIFTDLLLVDLRFACERWRRMPFAKFLNDLGAEPSPFIIPDLSNSSLEGGFRTRQREVLHDLATTQDRASPEAFTGQIVMAFIESLQQVSQLPMAYTSSKRIGMFPPLVQAGDLICVLKGFPLPVVLCKRDDGGHIYLGTCHVTGLMNGEAKELLRNGQARVEEIRIH